MNYDRIYEYRFKNINREKKKIIWNEIARFIYKKLNEPKIILDPASGNCEFINAISSSEKWALDMNENITKYADASVKALVGDSLTVDLPKNYFDAVFISNFLEHLNSQHEVALFLGRMFTTLKKGGKICVIGPNFKHVGNQYFDFADHTVILSELGVAEHLYGAGFSIKEIHPKFLPLSFRGRLPVNQILAKTYLQFPFFWWFFGKQFLLIAEKP